MNKPFKWGLGFLIGVIIANCVWLFALDSPSARFFTASWWQVWSAAYGVAIFAVIIGAVRLTLSKDTRSRKP